MRLDIKEKSKLDALTYCRLKKLPKLDDGESLWLFALALVAKRDGSDSYVLLKKNEKLENIIIKDFGNIATIKEIKNIYPFEFLKKHDLPNFSSKSGEQERLKYLSHYDNNDYSGLSVEELDKVILGKVVVDKIKNYVF